MQTSHSRVHGPDVLPDTKIGLRHDQANGQRFCRDLLLDGLVLPGLGLAHFHGVRATSCRKECYHEDDRNAAHDRFCSRKWSVQGHHLAREGSECGGRLACYLLLGNERLISFWHWCGLANAMVLLVVCCRSWPFLYRVCWVVWVFLVFRGENQSSVRESALDDFQRENSTIPHINGTSTRQRRRRILCRIIFRFTFIILHFYGRPESCANMSWLRKRNIYENFIITNYKRKRKIKRNYSLTGEI